MFSFPNFLSFSRMPLAVLFVQGSPAIRTLAVVIAMITDILDGFLARKRNQTSQFGAFLDPLMDKFFVVFALAALLTEKPLEAWKIVAFLCRDISVVLFGFFLAVKQMLTTYRLRSIFCGKISTFIQMMVLVAMSWDYYVPGYVFFSFIALGIFALGELYLSSLLYIPQKAVFDSNFSSKNAQRKNQNFTL